MLCASVLLGWLAICAQAFAPGPIRWGGLPTRNFVLAPQSLPNRASLRSKATVSSQPLMILDRPGTASPDEIPFFTHNTDKTISWLGTDLCIEASDREQGDVIRVNHCTGESNQLWNVLPNGQQKQIQLQGSSLCVDVNDEGGLNAAPVELRECDSNKISKSWRFESIPFPTQGPTQSPSISFSYVLVSFASMAALGVVGLGAWLWQQQKGTRVLSMPQDGGGLITDQGGVSMCESIALRQSHSPSLSGKAMNEQGLALAAMALGPIMSEGEGFGGSEAMHDPEPTEADNQTRDVKVTMSTSRERATVIATRARRAPTPRAVVSLEAPVFSNTNLNTELKMRILTAAASLDRGQSYNPTSSDAYSERMQVATGLIKQLVSASPPLPTSLAALDGEWELVYTDVAHGIFRSSPFFLAIQEAYARAGAPEKAELFFRLHELQTCSWGISKIGRVGQTIDSEGGMLYSEFDTNLLSLTTIPIIGFWKLLPTFGGCVITASSAELNGDMIEMEVEYTTSRPVPGLSGLRPLPGEWGKKIAEVIWSLKVPVGFVWKLLPWNGGNAPTCAVKLVYFDGDMRIVEDPSGQYFVYTRPVAPRSLDEKLASLR